MRRERGAASYNRGIRAEYWAALWLMLHGHRILARRWRCAAGEIDLVAMKRGVLIAVEVKARPTRREGLETIRPQQKARLQSALELFARASRIQPREMRLDAVVVTPRRLPHHLPDAWRPGF